MVCRRIPSQLRMGVRQLGTLHEETADIKHRAQAAIRRIDATSPFSPQLQDTFNRQHNYLRISLTERCNLRCFYCMPSEGVELSPERKILTNDEVLRLATLFVRNGVTKIRLTGGEPTVRKGILDIVSSLNDLRRYGLRSIGMTSNGLALHRKLPELVENGLTHLNLSLDTLDPFKFELITRRSGHDAVLKSLETALRLPLASIKVNVVIIRNLNDTEVLDFVEMTRDLSISVRFIEFMPFTGNKWDKKKMVPSSELLERIRARHPNIQRAPDELNDTARSWTISAYKGSFGFISSMSDHFCKTCNRLRLTADGQIKVCLFDPNEVSLRDKLRSGASDEELFETIGIAVKGKKEKHGGMENIDVVTNRPMILIGGLHPQRTPFQRKAPPISILAHIPSIITPHLQNTENRPTLRFYSTSRLSHLNKHGRASMVDVGDKPSTKRRATASGQIFIPKVAYDLVTSSYPLEDDNYLGTGAVKSAIIKSQRKGDALTIAQLAAIMGAKQTSNLIPLCHPIPLSKIDVKLAPVTQPSQRRNTSLPENSDLRVYSIKCIATVTCEGKTGVEMEALTAVTVGLLTVWDMLKAVAGKEMEIGEIMVVYKTGGQGGDFEREKNWNSNITRIVSFKT